MYYINSLERKNKKYGVGDRVNMQCNLLTGDQLFKKYIIELIHRGTVSTEAQSQLKLDF